MRVHLMHCLPMFCKKIVIMAKNKGLRKCYLSDWPVPNLRENNTQVFAYVL